MPQNNINKILPDNILDEEIKTLFLPFNTMQWMFLLPKYRFYKNLLIFNSRKLDIISLFSVIIATVSFLIRSLAYPTLISNVIYNVLVACDGVIFCSGYLLSYVLNLYHRKLNAGLVFNIHTIFKMYKFNKHMNIFIAISWFWFAAVVLFQAYVLAVFLISFKVILYDIILIYCSILFDINVICASRIVSLIASHLNLWISELDRLIEADLAEKTNDEQTFKHKDENVASVQTSANSNCMQEITRNEWTRLSQGYRKIFETYDMYKETFQILILYHAANSFMNVIILVQYSIEMIFNAPGVSIMLFNLGICMVTLKNLVLLFVISSSSQRFYTTVEKAQCACLNVIQNEGFRDTGARQACKNVLRLNKVAFEKMQACRVYAVDAPMPLRFVSVALNYVVVLIQIALGRK